MTVTELAGGGSEVVVQASQSLSYSARVSKAGLRLIVDLQGAVNAGADTSWTVPKGVVASVMLQTFRKRAAPLTRLIIGLERQASYRMVPGEGGLRIVLRPAKKTTASAARDVRSSPTSAKRTKKARMGRAQLRDVRFEQARGRDGISLSLDGNPRVHVVPRGARRTVLVLHDTELPTALQRQLDVSAYGGLVQAIAVYARHGEVWIDVDHRSSAVGRVLSEGDALRFVFSRGVAPARRVGRDGLAIRRVRTVAREAPFGGLQHALETTARQWSSDPDQIGRAHV
jgi:hypothetical protein